MSARHFARARRSVSRRTRDENGAAALEFALVAPLLFALIFGIIGYGYMLSFRQGISQGAAEGARAAAVAASDSETAGMAALNRSLESYGVSCSGTTLTRDGATVGTCRVDVDKCESAGTKNCAFVQVNYAYRDHPLLPSFPGLGGTLPENLDYEAVAEVN